MDPVSAFANVVTAIANLISKLVDGQTPEQKKKMWDWFIADVERWRAFFKLDEPKK